MRAVNSQELMGQVLDKLCAQTDLQWNSAPSGDEVFVTLSRQGVVAAMARSVDPFCSGFIRPPGTIAFVYRGLIRERERERTLTLNPKP